MVIIFWGKNLCAKRGRTNSWARDENEKNEYIGNAMSRKLQLHRKRYEEEIFLHVLLFRDTISWLFCIYWCFLSTNGLLLVSFFPFLVLLCMIIWEKRFVYSVHPCFKSDNLFCVYHLICCRLLYEHFFRKHIQRAHHSK